MRFRARLFRESAVPRPASPPYPHAVNRGHDYVERLGPGADGAPLVEYLTRRYPHTTAPEWRARVDAALVRVDGAPATARTTLRRGQVLVWHRPPWVEPAGPATFAVLWRDADLLAVAKPAGLPTIPGAGYLERTLAALVRAHDPLAAPVHRLGRFTSGVVLCGRGPEARAALARQWAERTVEKRYRALAAGAPQADTFTVQVPIGPLPHARLGRVHAASPAGRPASSEVRVLERRADGFLCDVRILTGRPHQVRIHLAAAGHPLVGDPLYGPGGVPLDDACSALPGDPGYLLHAAELRLRHPRDGTEWGIECAPPPALRRRVAG